MYILGKRTDKLIAEDIKRLVENKVQENKSLDYKKDFNFSQDKDRKEFLFDITSFYNTDGGCLIYGIEENKDEKGQNTGTPKVITGISIENYDKLIQQIEDTVKGNSEPSISNLAMNHIVIDGKSVLVIGVNKGLGLPSMVTFNETNKFYKRRNSGKYPVDVYELNQMFMQNQILKKSAEEFRLQRIDKVRSLNTIPSLDISTSFFIQIIPFSFLSEQMLDFTNLEGMQLTTAMKPMYCGGWDHMHNLDGFATFSTFLTSKNERGIYSYDQILRNGTYEIYTSHLFQEEFNHGTNAKIKCMYGDSFILESITKITEGLAIQKKFNLESPFIICLSIHGALGGTIKGSRGFSRPFMIDDILLPPIIMPTHDTDLYPLLKPIFDILWQSVGFSSSPIYTP